MESTYKEREKVIFRRVKTQGLRRTVTELFSGSLTQVGGLRKLICGGPSRTGEREEEVEMDGGGIPVLKDRKQGAHNQATDERRYEEAVVELQDERDREFRAQVSCEKFSCWLC